MRFGGLMALMASALLASGGIVRAQATDSPAETRIFLYQLGDPDAPPPGGQWRGGMALGTWRDFIPPAALPADVRAVGTKAEAKLNVALDDGGRITDCSEWNAAAPGALAQAACAALRTHARFEPRRPAPGSALAGRRLFQLRVETKAAAEWVDLENRASPSPPPPPGASLSLRKAREWPPQRPEYGTIAAAALPPLGQGDAARGKKATTGLLLDVLPDGSRHCEVMESAGDPARDAAACAAAKEVAWRYNQPCDVCYPQRVPLLALWDGKKSRLTLPTQNFGRPPKFVGEPLRPGDLGSTRPANLRTHATIYVAVGADGRAGACRIIYSGGDAALDARICALAVERGRFSPGSDLFGRPLAGEANYYTQFDKLFPTP